MTTLTPKDREPIASLALLYGLPEYCGGIFTDAARAKASEARIGARLYRQRPFSDMGDEAIAEAARILSEGRHTNAGMVYRVQAEAMFDWPIYRAAMAPQPSPVGCVFCSYPESDPRHGEPTAVFGAFAVNHPFCAPIGESDV